jgi:polyisoprenoid-binding protein YceI
MKSTSYLFLALLTTAAHAAEYQIDASHSGAQFAVKHLMVSNVKGSFSKMSGTVTWDAKKPEATAINATIDVASVDTRNGDRDKHLKSADFFDAEKFPSMTFKSNKVYKQNNTWKVAGDLTLHGITKPVVLDIVEGPSNEIKDPWGMMRTGATAKTKINRRDFGLTWNKSMDSGGVVVGEEIDITLDIEITRKA